MYFIENDDEKKNDKFFVEEDRLETVFHDEVEEKEIQKDGKRVYHAKREFVALNTLIEKENANLSPLAVSDEMEKSFLEYAMSVIVSRALPDARDGLKPVHRRILFAMNELGLFASSSHKKSVRVVGDVLGKYHPHGDSSIYEAMVRMAQDFSMRYPLVDGQGNFGSIDGDSAAAMRYTEAKMTKMAGKMVEDIKKNTVNFVPNYDGSDSEPSVLPARFPNLLVTGGVGIAVGMATSMPPHNLNEVIDGVVAYAKNNEITIEELCEYIKAPDFPTGGILIGTDKAKKAYQTGKGSILIRSKTHLETMKNDKQRIVVTEIPYMVNKSKLIEKIAFLVKNKVVEGISDLRDESSKEGIRMIVEIRRGFIANVILNKLFKLTPLESSFSINNIALVNNIPKLLNLKEIISVYFKHQINVVTRRTQFDYDKAFKRAHLLEGLKIAISNIDEVIRIIKSSSNDGDAQEQLMTFFALTAEQSKAIVDMRLGRLTGLAIEKMTAELKDLQITTEYLKNILTNEDVLKDVIITELEEIKTRFGDSRRSIINDSLGKISDEDLIPKKDIVVIMTHDGYVKRISIDEYTLQKRGGQGSKTTTTYKNDEIDKVIYTNTHKDLFILTNLGRVYRIRAHEIPEQSKQSKGTYFSNIIKFYEKEKVVEILTIDNYEENTSLLTISKKGIIKRTLINQYKNINKNGKRALTLREKDQLFGAITIKEEQDIIIGSDEGKMIKFSSLRLRNIGRTASGVKAITLLKNGKVIGFSHSSKGHFVLAIGEKGFGKLTELAKYRETNRGAKGVKTINIEKSGKLKFIEVVNGNEELMIITSNGKAIRIRIQDISITKSRNSKGVKIVKLKDKVKIESITIIPNEEIDNKEYEETTNKE